MEKQRFDYYATTLHGLEELLQKDVIASGGEIQPSRAGGTHFTAPTPLPALKLMMNSRVVSRVYKSLYIFTASSEKDMYQKLSEIKWKSLIESDQTFRLATVFLGLPQERKHFKNSHFCSLKVKDAIVDWYRHHHNERPNVSKDEPDVAMLIKVSAAPQGEFQIELLLDLSGTPLSHRGYRQAHGPAPMRENLAAGIIQLLNWDPEKEVFVDAMTGTATALIEAAWMKAHVSPQHLKLERFQEGGKPWCFLNYQLYTKDPYLQKEFTKLAQDLFNQGLRGLEKLKKEAATIQGFDLDQDSLKIAQQNLLQANLAFLAPLKKADATTLLPPELGSSCLFFCNPPYGHRLEETQAGQLIDLYFRLGENWKHHWKTHRSALITSDRALLKKISLRPRKKWILFNGDLECRLVEYNLYGSYNHSALF